MNELAELERTRKRLDLHAHKLARAIIADNAPSDQEAAIQAGSLRALLDYRRELLIPRIAELGESHDRDQRNQHAREHGYGADD